MAVPQATGLIHASHPQYSNGVKFLLEGFAIWRTNVGLCLKEGKLQNYFSIKLNFMTYLPTSILNREHYTFHVLGLFRKAGVINFKILKLRVKKVKKL